MSTTHFRFDELPAEIRNSIYNYALWQPKPVKISDHKPRKQRRQSVHLSRIGVNTAMLRTSRQVYKEAVVIFYGSTRFQFGGLLSLKTFLATIGRLKVHLRDIELEVANWPLRNLRNCFLKLKGAFRLRRVVFPPWTQMMSCGYIGQRGNFHIEAFDISKAMMERWYMEKKKQHLSVDDVVNILQFRNEDICGICKSGGTCASAGIGCKTKEEQAKESLEKYRALLVGLVKGNEQ